MEVEPSRILLVEDDPLNVELFQIAFNNYNCVNQIDVVEDGEQALEYLLGREGNPPTHPLPRLVLLDLRLPRINGVEVLRTLRSHPRTHNLVVVVMSSSLEDSDLNACYELGVNSYVVKPLDFEQFINVARQVGLYWMLINEPPLPPFQS